MCVLAFLMSKFLGAGYYRNRKISSCIIAAKDRLVSKIQKREVVP